MAIAIDALDHLVLVVSDIERLAQFYESLGFERRTFGEGRVALHFGEQKINLHQYGASFRPHACVPSVGSADLCFLVSTPVADVLSHLSFLGVPIEEGPVGRTGARGSILSIYLRDPDGNLLEFSNLLP